MIYQRLTISFLFVLLVFSQPALAQETVRIAVAANFKSTLEKLVKSWQSHNISSNDPVRISVSSASTGILYNQIVRGAPFDIFMSADEARPLLLEARHSENKSEIYAVGRLVYWFPNQPPILSDKAIVSQDKRLKMLILHENNQKMALANPKLAPYGKAAQSALTRLGLPNSISKKQVTGNNIAQVFQFVFSGAASSGFVALSQVQHQSIPTAQWLEIQVAEEYRIKQRMILLNSSHSAKAVYQYLKSAESRQIIAENGYALPFHE